MSDSQPKKKFTIKKKKFTVKKSKQEGESATVESGSKPIGESTTTESGSKPIGESATTESGSKPIGESATVELKVTSIKSKLDDCNASLFDESYKDRVELDAWTLSDKRIFPQFFRKEFESKVKNPRKSITKYIKGVKTDINPFDQQKLVSDYLNDNTPYRSLLLYHGLGSGKTGASIMTAEGYANRKIVVMLPKSIRKNYEDEINTFGNISYQTNAYWCFIPINLDKDDTKNENIYKLFTSKNIEKNLLIDLLKLNNNKGIWMIDMTKATPNFNSLPPISKDVIKKQTELCYNYRYTFIHYNMGAPLITHIFKTLYGEISYINIKINALGEDIADSEINKRTNKKLRYKLLEYMYNPDNKIKNPFDDKVIIIDEVHNLVSMMTGSGINGPIVYELLVRANNCKIIALSGTPVINYAYELSLLFNILRGYTKVYTIKLEIKEGVWNDSIIENILINTLLVNRITISKKTQTISFTRNPHGFISVLDTEKSGNIVNTGVTKDKKNNISEQEFIQIICSKLEENSYFQQGNVEKKNFNVFPDMLNTNSIKNSYFAPGSIYRELSEETFNEQYIDYDNIGVLADKKTIFKKKIVGLISFFNEIGGIDEKSGFNNFPTIEETSSDEVEVVMSDYQFSRYANSRKIERELEKPNYSKGDQRGEIKNQVESKTTNLFRVLSRQSSLFVFPANIKRPKAGQYRKKPTKKLEFTEEDITKEDVRELLRQYCNIDENPEYSITINEFIEKISEMNTTFFNEEILNNPLTSYPEDVVTFEQKLKYICSTRSDYFLDSDETYDEESITYLEAIDKALDNLKPENLMLMDDYSKVSSEIITLDKLSPKYEKTLKNIAKTPGLVFCYSQFRNAEGIGVFIKILDFNGYSKLEIDPDSPETIIKDETIRAGDKVRYSINPDKTIWKTSTVVEINDELDEYRLKDEPKKMKSNEIYKCFYALWTGSESVEQRSSTLKLFNNIDNIFGQKCLILLTTSSGSEGISLMNVRQVHILEPYWNNVRIKQVIGRARRIRSHINLPEDQQNVKVFNYVIKFSDEQLDGTWKDDNSGYLEYLKTLTKEELDKKGISEQLQEIIMSDASSESLSDAMISIRRTLSQEINDLDNKKTSDESLQDIANKKVKILDDFLNLMKEVAIDCEFNKQANLLSDETLSTKVKCFNTIPSNNPTDIYNFDLKSPLIYEEGILTEDTLEKIVHTIRILKVKLQGNKFLHYIVFLPIDKTTIEENIKTDGDSIDIYDYYVYYNLDYSNSQHNLNTKNKIGKIIKSGMSFKTVFTEEFKRQIEHYISIEDIISKLDNSIPPTNVSDRIKWSELVRKQSKSTLLKKWTCIICKKEYLTNIKLCLECKVGTPEMFETLESQKSFIKKEGLSASSLEKPSQEKTESKKIKVSKFGKKKK